MTYSQIAQAIKSLNVPSGTTKRVHCVACGGHNTLGVTNRSGNLSWHCFRASCGVKGRADTTVTLSDLKRIRVDAPSDNFTLPSHLTYVSNPESISWLRRYNCTTAISKRLAEVRYDPKEHRIVFLVRDSKGTLVDAAGRSLGSAKPKWRRYGKSGLPLVVGSGGTAYVVEDAASACAVSCLGAGVALLGTHLTPEALLRLKRYHRVVIMLDPDAKAKALTMERLIAPYVNTKIVFLADDPKCFSETQLREMLKGTYDEAKGIPDD